MNAMSPIENWHTAYYLFTCFRIMRRLYCKGIMEFHLSSSDTSIWSEKALNDSLSVVESLPHAS